MSGFQVVMIAAMLLEMPVALAKPFDIGRDPARSAWVTSQTSPVGKSCCGLGDGRMVDSRVTALSDDGPFVWQIKLYKGPGGHGWLFGIPEEVQFPIDPDNVHEDKDAPGIGWLDVPPELDSDQTSFAGKGFAWYSIGYRRLECFRKPVGY